MSLYSNFKISDSISSANKKYLWHGGFAERMLEVRGSAAKNPMGKMNGIVKNKKMLARKPHQL
jgi:hypothetical protein